MKELNYRKVKDYIFYFINSFCKYHTLYTQLLFADDNKIGRQTNLSEGLEGREKLILKRLEEAKIWGSAHRIVASAACLCFPHSMSALPFGPSQESWC